MTRRSPEQVHDNGGHKEFVASCTRCVTEAEQDRNAAAARADLVGESGPELIDPGNINLPSVPLGEQDAEEVRVLDDVNVFEVVATAEGGTAPGKGVAVDVDPVRIAGVAGTFDATDYPDAEDPAVSAARRKLTATGRPGCYVDQCPLPEFADAAGLCGGHWSTRPDLRKAARHD